MAIPKQQDQLFQTGFVAKVTTLDASPIAIA
jgi:hypothetical protein